MRVKGGSSPAPFPDNQTVSVGGGSLSKQRLPRRGNTTAVVFPKRLKLSVISRAHSALAAFGIRLAYGSSLKPQKPC